MSRKNNRKIQKIPMVKVKKEPKIIKAKREKLPKTRNAGTWTETTFWSMIRSALRSKSRWWLPRLNALKKARRSSQSSNKRLKWEFLCFKCKDWFPQTEVEIHHMVEAGSLKKAEDLPGFVERLFAEEGWECVCKGCHLEVLT